MHRSEATANMTIPEFQAAKLQQNGKMLMEVWGHKTVVQFAAVNLQLYQKDFEQLQLLSMVQGREGNLYQMLSS